MMPSSNHSADDLSKVCAKFDGLARDFGVQQWLRVVATATCAGVPCPDLPSFVLCVNQYAAQAQGDSADAIIQRDRFETLVDGMVQNMCRELSSQRAIQEVKDRARVQDAADLEVLRQSVLADHTRTTQEAKRLLDAGQHSTTHAAQDRAPSSSLCLHFPSTMVSANNGSGNPNNTNTIAPNNSNNAGNSNQVAALLPFRGMRNMGNTCFAAGAVTLLLTSPRIGTALEQLCQQGKAPAEQALLLRQLWDARQSILGNSNNNRFNIKDLIVDVPQYREGHQYDADEYLRHLLMQRAPCIYYTKVTNGEAAAAKTTSSKKGTAKRRGREDAATFVYTYDVDDELAYSVLNHVPLKDGSITLIAGCSETTSTCAKKGCGHINSCTRDSWSILQLPMNVNRGTNTSVKQLIDKVRKPDTIESNEVCSTCGTKSNVVNSDKFKHLPQVLLVNVKRFSDKNKQQVVAAKTDEGKKSHDFEPMKRSDVVELTEVLEFDDATGKVKFELRGFVVHIGETMEGGHYISYARLPFAEDQANNTGWIEFSDANVQRAASDLLTRDNTKTNVYLLRYERV